MYLGEDIKMKGKTLITCLILVAAFCSIAAAEAVNPIPSDASNSKFLTRIAKKCQLLETMNQNANEMSEICSRIGPRTIPTKDSPAITSSDVCDTNKSDLKYLCRLEGKLNVLVNDTLNNTTAQPQASFRPMVMGNLLPESRFDSVEIEEELEKEKLVEEKTGS